MHSFIQEITRLKPNLFSVYLDGKEIYRGEFTADGIRTIIDEPVNPNALHRLLNICLDGASTPAYSIDLTDEVKPIE